MSLYKKYYVYLIISRVNSKIISYVGFTENVQKRLFLHNNNKGAKFTRGKKWKIIYIKKYRSKSVAMKNEYLLKKDIKKRNLIKLKFLQK